MTREQYNELRSLVSQWNNSYSYGDGDERTEGYAEGYDNAMAEAAWQLGCFLDTVKVSGETS